MESAPTTGSHLHGPVNLRRTHLRTLRRGWPFPDREHINVTIAVNSILIEDTDDALSIADAVESELLNMDLRSIGAKSLPELAVLRKSTHLLGPNVLQKELGVKQINLPASPRVLSTWIGSFDFKEMIESRVSIRA
ncbi:hypothetical protein SAY87_006206 [Trapa incisa]|uniref:Uncharacterized protein n=1 Tax=Trapa incisa TaxID=236973 RepID=A0AAN7Q8E3_9MYRT|nr:hypothetical protein SAY87_006206 [Trapa incisa]